MSDPITPQQPFQPDARPVRSGCGKAAIIGCGGLLVVLVVLGIVAIVKVKEITAWGFGVMEKQVMARLPAETTDEEARRIRQGFAAVTQAVQEDTVDPNALEQLQPIILRFADPNRSPKSEDVQRLIELLEAAAGTAPPEPRTEAPTETPTETPIESPDETSTETSTEAAAAAALAA